MNTIANERDEQTSRRCALLSHGRIENREVRSRKYQEDHEKVHAELETRRSVVEGKRKFRQSFELNGTQHDIEDNADTRRCVPHPQENMTSFGVEIGAEKVSVQNGSDEARGQRQACSEERRGALAA